MSFHCAAKPAQMTWNTLCCVFQLHSLNNFYVYCLLRHLLYFLQIKTWFSNARRRIRKTGSIPYDAAREINKRYDAAPITPTIISSLRNQEDEASQSDHTVASDPEHEENLKTKSVGLNLTLRTWDAARKHSLQNKRKAKMNSTHGENGESSKKIKMPYDAWVDAAPAKNKKWQEFTRELAKAWTSGNSANAKSGGTASSGMLLSVSRVDTSPLNSASTLDLRVDKTSSGSRTILESLLSKATSVENAEKCNQDKNSNVVMVLPAKNKDCDCSASHVKSEPGLDASSEADCLQLRHDKVTELSEEFSIKTEPEECEDHPDSLPNFLLLNTADRFDIGGKRTSEPMDHGQTCLVNVKNVIDEVIEKRFSSPVSEESKPEEPVVKIETPFDSPSHDGTDTPQASLSPANTSLSPGLNNEGKIGLDLYQSGFYCFSVGPLLDDMLKENLKKKYLKFSFLW